MEQVRKTGMPLMAGLFLVMAVIEYFQDDNWVVWLVLAMMFGALRALPVPSKGPASKGVERAGVQKGSDR